MAGIVAELPWIQSHMGRMVSLSHPHPEQIHIEDIAQALSQLCRFTGHTKQFYSVAQHSLLVSDLVSPELALVGLLHDAPEAYLGDLSSPLRNMLREEGNWAFERAMDRMWSAICARFDLDPDMLPLVKDADMIALATERRDLLQEQVEWDLILPKPSEKKIIPTPQLYVWSHFLGRFRELTR